MTRHYSPRVAQRLAPLVLDTVRAFPGSTTVNIASAIGVRAAGSAWQVLRKLENNGLVRSEWLGRKGLAWWAVEVACG